MKWSCTLRSKTQGLPSLHVQFLQNSTDLVEEHLGAHLASQVNWALCYPLKPNILVHTIYHLVNQMTIAYSDGTAGGSE